jgi:hypothetical protein
MESAKMSPPNLADKLRQYRKDHPYQDLAASFVPYLGTALAVDDFVQDPSALGAAGIALSPLTKAMKMSKAPKQMGIKMYRASYPENHATKKGRGTFYTPDKKTAEMFNRPGKSVQEFDVSNANTFDYENKDHVYELVNALAPKTIRERADLADRLSHGDWGLLEKPRVLETLRKLGHKGYTTNEFSSKNLALFDD